MERFMDNGETLWDFARDGILVACPRCARKGRIGDGRLNCGACGFSRGAPPFSMTLERRCHHCGGRASRQVQAQWGEKRDYPVRCSCGMTYTMYTNRSADGEPPNLALFDANTRLWLRTDVDGKELWAYNRRHLEHLRAFVMSPLREHIGTMPGSAITVLPRWVKLAKNRDMVLQVLDRMESRLTER